MNTEAHTYQHKDRIVTLGSDMAGNRTYEPAIIVRAKRNYNFSEHRGDAKCGDGFRMGKYQHPGEFTDGVWYIVKYADGGSLCIHESGMLPAQREAV
jgi:hypothetical protein